MNAVNNIYSKTEMSVDTMSIREKYFTQVGDMFKFDESKFTNDCIVSFWAEIPGFPKYLVSSEARIWGHHNKKPRKIDIDRCRQNCMRVSLRIVDSMGEAKSMYLHRLVAMAFLKRDEHHIEVNHINGDGWDNRLWNLEWCTAQENIIHGRAEGIITQSDCKRKIIQFNLDNELLNTYESIQDAGDINGFNTSSISKACRGKIKKYKGYIWKYEDYDREVDRSEWRTLDGYSRYIISPCGEVYNTGTKRTLTATKDGKYPKIALTPDADKTKKMSVHRLVAKLYVDNPHNYPNVDHIDTDPTNNHYTNLRWCTQSQNINNPTTKAKVGRRVVQMDKQGNKIAVFPNMRDASKSTGTYHTSIIKNIKGEYKSAGGFTWREARDDEIL